MTQSQNRIFDEMARLMNDAASVAQGVRREAETAFRAQIERLVADLDLVKREEFDVVREMASKARQENEALKVRVAQLEEAMASPSQEPRSARKTPAKAAAKPAAKPKRAPRTTRTKKA